MGSFENGSVIINETRSSSDLDFEYSNITDGAQDLGNSTIATEEEWTVGDYVLQGFIAIIVIAIIAIAIYGIAYALDKGITNLLIRPNDMAADEAEIFAPRKRRTKTNYTDKYTQKEEKSESRKPPPAPVLLAKKETVKSDKVRAKRKEEVTDNLITKDTDVSTRSVIVTGTQNARIKDPPPTKIPCGKGSTEQVTTSMPPNIASHPKACEPEPRQGKTETKSNIPWYLQD